LLSLSLLLSLSEVLNEAGLVARLLSQSHVTTEIHEPIPVEPRDLIDVVPTLLLKARQVAAQLELVEQHSDRSIFINGINGINELVDGVILRLDPTGKVASLLRHCTRPRSARDIHQRQAR